MAHGGRLEELEILGQMPGDGADVPNNPVFRHGDDGFHLKRKMTEGSRAETQGRRDEEKEKFWVSCPKTPRLRVSAGNILRLRILNSDWSLDCGMGIVAFEGEVLVAEILQGLHFGIEQHPGKRTRLARELKPSLLQMVGVEMEVTECVDEFLGFQSADLRHHEREQGVGGDVEGDAEEEIRAALVELTA